MQNFAGHPNSTAIASTELQGANITIVPVNEQQGEVKATVVGRLGQFVFRRAWVYWAVRAERGVAMSEAHARQINDAVRGSKDATKYSGDEHTWGGVIRVDGMAGGDNVSGPVDSWHIDTQDGLAYFADKLREFGYA